jgi:hypothetical protein
VRNGTIIAFRAHEYFAHHEALAKLQYAASADNIRTTRLSQEIDVETCGHSQKNWPHRPKDGCIHCHISEAHQGRAGNRVARAQVPVVMEQPHLGRHIAHALHAHSFVDHIGEVNRQQSIEFISWYLGHQFSDSAQEFHFMLTIAALGVVPIGNVCH